VQVAYFDQQREQLDPEKSVVDTVADGNDTVTVGGRTRHVHGYLQDFLFPPERAQSPVKALSGGERNRLLLARLLTRPANVLVLDEPTNDLDLETLELLEQLLIEFPGTILVVSHDRRFLDNVVTSTLAFEGGGRIEEYVGGYTDWLQQRPEAIYAAGGLQPAAPATPTTMPVSARPAASQTPKTKKKRSYNEQREFEALPARIDALEAERAQLEAAVASPEFYKEPADAIRRTLARIEELRAELDRAYARWGELDR
jgi:ATP-binding cassette subfamily F protein uup